MRGHDNLIAISGNNLSESNNSHRGSFSARRNSPGTGVNGLDIPLQDALLYGNAKSRWVLSSIPKGFDFIGAKPGQPFWILPQNAGQHRCR